MMIHYNKGSHKVSTKVSATCTHGGLKVLKLFIVPISLKVFLLTGISITRTGISNKNPAVITVIEDFIRLVS